MDVEEHSTNVLSSENFSSGVQCEYEPSPEYSTANSNTSLITESNLSCLASPTLFNPTSLPSMTAGIPLISFGETSSSLNSHFNVDNISSQDVSDENFGLKISDSVVKNVHEFEPYFDGTHCKVTVVDSDTKAVNLSTDKILDLRNDGNLTINGFNSKSKSPLTGLYNYSLPLQEAEIIPFDYQFSVDEGITESRTSHAEELRMYNPNQLFDRNSKEDDCRDSTPLPSIHGAILNNRTYAVRNVLDVKNYSGIISNIDHNLIPSHNVKGTSVQSLSNSSEIKGSSYAVQEALSLMTEREKLKSSSTYPHLFANPSSLSFGLVSHVLEQHFCIKNLEEKSAKALQNQNPDDTKLLPPNDNLREIFSRDVEEYKSSDNYRADSDNADDCSMSSNESPGGMFFDLESDDGVPKSSHHCKSCNASFNSKSNLRLHMRIHTGKNPYTCKECGESFPYCSLYYEHKLKHQGIVFKPFQCSICRMTFNCEKHFESHKKKHGDIMMHKCSNCDQCFATKDRLNKHSKTHINEISFFCEKCGKLFLKKSAYEQHKSVHASSAWNCAECGEVCHTANKLEKHILSCHNEMHNLESSSEIIPINTNRKLNVEKFTCEICCLRFDNVTEFYVHRDTHSNDALYKCSVCKSSLNCDKCYSCFKSSVLTTFHKKKLVSEPSLKRVHCDLLFQNSDDLLSHSLTHNGDKPYQCTECNATFKHSSTLKVHQRVHFGESSFICPQCGATFIQKAHLHIHLRSHSNDKPYKCMECDASFTKKDYLVAHVSKHSSIMMVEDCLSSQSDEHDLNSLQCKYCGLTFTHQSTLATHVRKHTGERPFVCEDCGASFLYSSNLTTHRRKHTGERPYVCKECDASFTLKSYLTMHLRKHSGERPFKCDICSSSFTQKTHLSTHRRIHTGEYPYKCEICGDAFRDGANFWRHKKRHAGGESPIQTEFQKGPKSKRSKTSRKKGGKKVIPSTPSSISLQNSNPLFDTHEDYRVDSNDGIIPIPFTKMSDSYGINETAQSITSCEYSGESLKMITSSGSSTAPFYSIVKSEESTDYSLTVDRGTVNVVPHLSSLGDTGQDII